MPPVDPLESCTGFDWDDANVNKNWDRHGVTPEEAEDVFFQEPLVVRHDAHHSQKEKRYYALGQTKAERLLFVAFTVRRGQIRVISVRDMNKHETAIYANYEKEATYLQERGRRTSVLGDSGFDAVHRLAVRQTP